MERRQHKGRAHKQPVQKKRELRAGLLSLPTPASLSETLAHPYTCTQTLPKIWALQKALPGFPVLHPLPDVMVTSPRPGSGEGRGLSAPGG